MSSGAVFPALSRPDNVALKDPEVTTIWLFSRVTVAAVFTPSTCTAVCPAATFSTTGGPTVVVVTIRGNVVVVTTVLGFVDTIVVVGTVTLPATSTGRVVVVGASVEIDADLGQLLSQELE